MKPSLAQQTQMQKIRASLKKRHNKEKRLKYYGLISVLIGLVSLVVLLSSITLNGYTALQQTMVLISVTVNAEDVLDENGNISEEVMYATNWDGIAKKTFRKSFEKVTDRRDKRKLSELLSANAGYTMKKMVASNPELIGRKLDIWVKTSDDVDQYMKGRMNVDVPEDERRIND